ncbi:hypothetical protein [Nocardia sp. NPDC056100]|uniref:hypothetical protein n=1 Tax=Nocardia sp. NPDC056100 TaxID=3345712 RepID=UPI0035DE7C50
MGALVARKAAALLAVAAVFGIVGFCIGIKTLASSEVKCNGIVMHDGGKPCGTAGLDRDAKRDEDVDKAWKAVAAGLGATVVCGGAAISLAVYSIRRDRQPTH